VRSAGGLRIRPWRRPAAPGRRGCPRRRSLSRRRPHPGQTHLRSLPIHRRSICRTHRRKSVRR